MIGKVIIGTSFRGCLHYCLNDKIHKHQAETVMKDRAEVLLLNKCYGDQKELVAQFNEVRRLNPKLSKPVMHITLSLAPGETLSKDKLMEMSQQCARDMGFENNQYVAIHHRDTSHQHLHIVANRVGYDKKTVSDSNSYKKIAAFCRKMELQYNLKQVLSPKQFLSKEQRHMPRHDQRKEQLRQHVQHALKDSQHFQEFEQKMKDKGYQVVKGRGISFIDDKNVKVKGSELNYSLQTIERILQKQRAPGLQPSPEKYGIRPGESDRHLQYPYVHQKPAERQNGMPNQQHSFKNAGEELSTVLAQVIQPEVTNGQSAIAFLQHPNRKKKRKRSQHL